MKFICDYINTYKENKQKEENLKVFARIKNWHSIILDELKVFIGLLLFTNKVKFPNISDH